MSSDDEGGAPLGLQPTEMAPLTPDLGAAPLPPPESTTLGPMVSPSLPPSIDNASPASFAGFPTPPASKPRPLPPAVPGAVMNAWLPDGDIEFSEIKPKPKPKPKRKPKRKPMPKHSKNINYEEADAEADAGADAGADAEADAGAESLFSSSYFPEPNKEPWWKGWKGVAAAAGCVALLAALLYWLKHGRPERMVTLIMPASTPLVLPSTAVLPH